MLTIMTAAAAVVRDDTPHEDHFVHLRGVTWPDYERLLRLRGEASVPRLSYLQGILEMRSPSRTHEGIKSLIAGLLEAWCLDRGIELMPFGSWTLKERAEERGAEPDECYVFGTEPAERPHLAIEVEWTSGGLDKLEIYRRLGVGEVWHWRQGVISVHVLKNGAYHRVAASKLVPGLDLGLLATFLDRPTLTQAVRAFRAATLRAAPKRAPRRRPR